jgi:tRNA pseudouridine38-40 synthase
MGNRFLHHMVRYLVGSMIAVNDNRLTKSDFLKLIRKPKKEVQIFKAPPQGLILETVFYD